MSINPLKSSPSKLRDFYNIPPRDPSKPISIGIYEEGSYAFSGDVKLFYDKYLSNLNLKYRDNFSNPYPGTKNKPCNVEFVDYCGSTSCSENSARTDAIDTWNATNNKQPDGEASLDIQIICGICQMGLHNDDKITFFVHNPTITQLSYNLFTYLDTNKNISDIPRIWSVSYGIIENDEYFGELENRQKIQDIINDLSKNHFQIFISSGDSGSSNYRGDYLGPIQTSSPATFPYITAVGGTIISEDNNYEYPSTTTLDTSGIISITTGGGMEGCRIDCSTTDCTITVNPEFDPTNYDELTDFYNSQNSAVGKYLTELSNATSSNISKDFITEIKNNSSDFYPRAYPNLSLQSINYPTFINGSSYPVAGTSASSPLMASIYAIIASKLSFTTSQYGKLNSQLFAANESNIWQKKVFKPVFSYNQQNDNNGATEKATEIAQYSWNVAESRLSGSNGDGYGFDCVVGLGSINATNLMNYISCAHIPIEQQMTDIYTQPLTYNIDKLTITSNNMNIKYSHPADKPTNKYSCDTKKGECVPDASSTKSFTQCSSNCVADTYKCNKQTGHCEKDKTPQPDGSTYSMCSPVCTKVIVPSPTPDPSPDKYKCNTQTGHCEKTTDGSGSLLDDCNSNCSIKPPTYSCVNNSCIPDTTSNKTLCECNTTCTEDNSQNYQLLTPTSSVQMIAPYTFNNVSYNDNDYIAVKKGLYTLTGITTAHPMGFVINDKSKFEVISGTEHGNKLIEGLNIMHYTGNITFEVKNNFKTISYNCYNHGYMGGEKRLLFIN